MAAGSLVQRTFNFESFDTESLDRVAEAYESTAALDTVDREKLASCNAGQLISRILGAGSFPDEFETPGLPLKELPSFSLQQLASLSPAFGPTDLQRLLAAVELGRRVAEARMEPQERVALSSSHASIAYCRKHFARLIQDGVQEEFHILLLDTKNRVTGSHLITVGTLDASLVHPREVFRPAIRNSASSIIAVHNHPSGDPTPSQEDRAVTRRLEEAGKTLGIDLLDHIIVAREGVKSVREESQ